MTIARLLRRSTHRRRSRHLAVIVLPNEATAFQAYRLLQYPGRISPENLAIVGEGYSSPDRVGLLKPSQIAANKARSLGCCAALFGTLLSLVISLIGQVSELAVVVFLTAVLSGFCGAIVGALIGYFGEGNTASIYRHHLNQGRYLLMIEGSETLVSWGQRVLSHYSSPSPY